jgi:hypothetical protein
VKLNPEANDTQDALLIELMHTTFRKFTWCFGNTQKSY